LQNDWQEEKMKNLILTLMMAILVASCLVYAPYDENRSSATTKRYEQPYISQTYGEISIAFIYDYLGRFGYWVSYSPYGYVWVPRGAGRHWRPYTRGRWVWTDYGWTWFSDYEWGWIPFHYGRWGWDRHLGWFWVSDIVWAPAWVVWRFGDFYVGWAPLPPEVEFVVGYGLRWRAKEIPPHHWIFVEGRRFGERRLHNWVIPPERNMTIINFTSLRDRITVRDRQTIINDGISRHEIERISRRPVTRVTVKEVQKPEETGMQMDELRLYKPTIKSDSNPPKMLIKAEEVEQKMSPEREIERPEEIEDIHRQEIRILEKTQKMEIERLKQQTEEEVKAVPPEEKQKKSSELQAKIEELKKKHESEKLDMQKRQAEEKEMVKRGSLRKKSETEKH
jgi:hypothetical protein